MMTTFRRTLATILWAAPLTMLVPWLGGTTAHAQDVLFEGDVLQLVPVGEVVGDGLTPVTLHLLALNSQGQPFAEPELRVQTTGGRLGLPKDLGGGVYELIWIPPAVTQDRVLNITLKGKTLDKQRLKASWAFPVLAPLSQRVSVGANPAQMTLGRDDATTLSIELSGGAVGSAEGAELELRASSGSLGPFVSLGGGKYTVRYLPPESMQPHFAMVTTSDLRMPGATYGHQVIPMVGSISQNLEGPSDGQALIRVGDRELGPFQLDSRGRAQVDIPVPPGISSGTLITIKEGERTEQPLPLEIAPWRRILLVPGHRSIPADPQLQVPIRLVVINEQGQPDSEAAPTLVASGGSITDPIHEGAGVYFATWTPPASAEGGTASIQAKLSDSEQGDEVEIALLPLRPSQLTLSTTPTELAEDDTEFELSVGVADQQGRGLSGREISLQTAGAKVLDGPKDLGDGTYTARLSAKGLAAEVVATVKAPASENPVQQLIALPNRPRLLNDGLSSTMLTILTLDEFGYPVANQAIGIQVISGSGSVPESAATDDAGVAQVYYTAGREAEIVHLQIESAGHTAAVGLLQLPEGAAEALQLPPSGPQSLLDQAKAWSAIVGFVEVERAGLP